jgi:hypothetical protein
MAVLRTFADGETTVRTRSMIRRGQPARRLPYGDIHVAPGATEHTLCGLDIGGLAEFVGSEAPFGGFPEDRRCTACDKAVRYPTA